MRVISMASARIIAGAIEMGRRASIDLRATRDPRRRTLWAKRLHFILRGLHNAVGRVSRPNEQQMAMPLNRSLFLARPLFSSLILSEIQASQSPAHVSTQDVP